MNQTSDRTVVQYIRQGRGIAASSQIYQGGGLGFETRVPLQNPDPETNPIVSL